MTNIQSLAKRLRRSHDLAAALWDTGWYEQEGNLFLKISRRRHD